MALTPAQRTALKAFIDNDPELAAYPMNQDGYLDLANRLNQEATPATFYVWRSSVPIDEIMRNGMDWTLVDGLTVGKARIWEWLGRLGAIDASKVNVRAGIDEAWKGTGAALVAVRANIYAHYAAVGDQRRDLRPRPLPRGKAARQYLGRQRRRSDTGHADVRGRRDVDGRVTDARSVVGD